MDMIEMILGEEVEVLSETIPPSYYENKDILLREYKVITPQLRIILNALGIYPLSLWDNKTLQLLRSQPEGVKELLGGADVFNFIDKRIYHSAIKDNNIVFEPSVSDDSDILQDHEHIVFICNDLSDIPTLMEEVLYEVVKSNKSLLALL